MTRFFESASRIIHRNGFENHRRRRIINHFVNKLGFVYFGSVDQHEDDHHIIRGLTVSPTHEDNNYSVGSYEGYDVSIVDRTDSITSVDKADRTHTWLIFEIKLHARIDVPHMFLGGHSHPDESAYTRLFTAFPAIQKVPLGTFGTYNEEFISRYSLYTDASHFIEAEQYITPAVAQSIAAHFWPLSVEVREGLIYLYADNTRITTHDLSKMLQSGIWLARTIDEVANQ